MRAHLTVFFCWCSAACAPQVVNAVDDLPMSDAGLGQSSGSGSGGAESGGAGVETGGSVDRPDAETADAGGTAPEPTLRGDALIHRYSFNGTGSEAIDAKGAAHGKLIATQLSGTGFVTLDGTVTPAEYVDLPNQLISGLSDATFEVWLTWGGGDVWQRIFDFGDDLSQQEDARSSGRSYLFLSPHGAGNYLRAVYRAPDTDEIKLDVAPALPASAARYVALVFDDSHDELRLYVDGTLSGSVAVAGKLSQIHDVNDWLGRSQFAIDAAFSGSIDEFRIYDQALSSAEIAKSMQAGPDVTFPEP